MFQIHCLYCQTPGQLEDFFKLESYLLDISTKSIVLPEKSIYRDILIPNSRSGNKTFVHCSSRYQAGHVITIFLYLLLKFILGDSYSSCKSSAKAYIGNISIINPQSLYTSQSRVRFGRKLCFPYFLSQEKAMSSKWSICGTMLVDLLRCLNPEC